MRVFELFPKRLIALMVLLIVLASSSQYAKASADEFIGSPINVYIDTQASEVQIFIPDNWIENQEFLDLGLGLKVSKSDGTQDQGLDCNQGVKSLSCSLAMSRFQDLTSMSPNWASEEQGQFKILGTSVNGDSYTWPLVFYKVDNLIPNEVQVTDSVDSEYLVGIDSKKIAVTINVLNREGSLVDADVTVTLNERTVMSGPASAGVLVFNISESLLTIGSNEFSVSVENEFGQLDRTYTLKKSLPEVKSITFDTPKTFFPAKDNYEDNLSFSVIVTSGSSKPFVGTGSMTLSTSSGKVLMKGSFVRPGAFAFTYKPPASGYSVGDLKLTATFQPKVGKKVTASTKVVASPKRMVESQGSVTVTAWQAKYDCGDSYHPCERGSLSGSSNGIALYNDPFDLNHRSMFFVKLPSGAFKWKLSLLGVWTGLSSPSFNLNATDGSYSEGKGFIGSTPGTPGWEGTWSSNIWIYSVSDGGANWVFESYEPGYFYFQSVTIQYATRTLK